jgi:predicted Zn-dependent peptidase
MMKKIIKLLVLVPLLLLVQCSGKKESNTTDYQTKTITEDGYTYETVTNDPLNARIYTLKNGLKVYISVFKEAPRIQTFIAVRAGSKNDPSTATGLAHYLEHLVFKGTSNIGTMNWEKEKVELDKIKELYQVYGQTTNEKERKNIYKQIDSISYIAAGYAVANEYDKMISAIGGKGTNAYTSLDQTVYVNDIPANQLERWIEIEAERFGELVPRLFHTELEAVYEEKNRSLDNDFFKVYEELYKIMFKNHTYGTQTTIGTIEHLKNPSIVEIEKYFYKYYVPNNMAICLSGDLDPSATIKAIDKFWGSKESKNVEQPTFEPEPEITEPIKSEVIGPNAEFLMMAYRLPGASSKDAMIMDVVSNLLSNGTAGLIDLNLNQKMLVQAAAVSPDKMNDFSILRFYGQPKAGQDLEAVKDLILAQVDSVKQGKFEDEMLQSIVNNLKIQKMKINEENWSRADVFVNTFINNISWIDQVKYIDDMNKITKNDVMDFANKYLGNNYGYVLKKEWSG